MDSARRAVASADSNPFPNENAVFEWNQHRPDNAENVLWDAIIVGTGMGGSSVGLSLMGQGLKVLFVERGVPLRPSPPGPRPSRWQRLLNPDSVAAELAARGVWNRRVTASRNGRTTTFFAPLGNGPGGSSVVYGAVLERFRREDFSGSTGDVGRERLPNAWPIDYDQFVPYYRRAEALLGVRGTPDPSDPDDDSSLRTPPPLSERDRHFFEAFRKADLSPYRLHVGIDYAPGCIECQGVACASGCKAGAANRALQPALAGQQAKLLTDFCVERLAMNSQGVDGVIGRLEGREIRLRGRIVVLAAGALGTPLILLRSTSEQWPTGVGNANDLVGRGLMFHASEYFALWPSTRVEASGPGKTLSSRAMYTVDGQKLGSFQSVGTPIYPTLVSDFLMAILDRALPFRIPLARIATLAAAVLGQRFLRRAALFATIVEDFAYRGNRIVPAPAEPSGFKIVYDDTQELTARTAAMRGFIRQRLTGHKPFFLSSGDSLNYGHPAGTCRFGNAPEHSVLTPDNRVHGVPNLFVADASFFPSSGGVNPSLTIFANGLRVGEIIARQLRG